jgi:hypothetical protein
MVREYSNIDCDNVCAWWLRDAFPPPSRREKKVREVASRASPNQQTLHAFFGEGTTVGAAAAIGEGAVEERPMERVGLPSRCCVGCWAEGVRKLAAYPGQQDTTTGKSEPHTYCTAHARQYGTWKQQYPCRLCAASGLDKEGCYPDPVNKTKRGLCADHARDPIFQREENKAPAHSCVACWAEGERKSACFSGPSDPTTGECKTHVYCAAHARQRGTWKPFYSCRLCAASGIDTEGSYPDPVSDTQRGLCAHHARELDSWCISRPCRLCAEDGVEVYGHFPDPDHVQHYGLCAYHAREIGSWAPQQPCRLCAQEGREKEGQYPDPEKDTIRGLCADHARELGSWRALHPCSLCTQEGEDKNGSFREPATGSLICGPHALNLGVISKLGGCSKEACNFFDLWLEETGQDILHLHVSGAKVEGSEVAGLVPKRRFKPDGYVAEKKEAWFYHGDWWHGYPPWHPEHESFVHHGEWGPDLYKATMDMMDAFVQQGITVRYIWGTDFHVAKKKNDGSLVAAVRTIPPGAIERVAESSSLSSQGRGSVSEGEGGSPLKRVRAS